MGKILQQITEEANRIEARTGYYIPPFKLAGLMKTATKIIEYLTNGGANWYTYEDCLIVLDIVRDCICRVKEGKKKTAPVGANNEDGAQNEKSHCLNDTPEERECQDGNHDMEL